MGSATADDELLKYITDTVVKTRRISGRRFERLGM
jgi:hypothetical protein